MTFSAQTHVTAPEIEGSPSAQWATDRDAQRWVAWLTSLPSDDRTSLPPADLCKDLAPTSGVLEIIHAGGLAQPGHPALAWAFTTATGALTRDALFGETARDLPRASEGATEPRTALNGNPFRARRATAASDRRPPTRAVWASGLLGALPLARLEAPDGLPAVLSAWATQIEDMRRGAVPLGMSPALFSLVMTHVHSAWMVRQSPAMAESLARLMRAWCALAEDARQRVNDPATPEAECHVARAWVSEWHVSAVKPFLVESHGEAWQALWPTVVADWPVTDPRRQRVAFGTAQNTKIHAQSARGSATSPEIVWSDLFLDWLEQQRGTDFVWGGLAASPRDLLAAVRSSPTRWTRAVLCVIRLLSSARIVEVLRGTSPVTGQWPPEVLRLLLLETDPELRLLGARLMGQTQTIHAEGTGDATQVAPRPTAPLEPATPLRQGGR